MDFLTNIPENLDLIPTQDEEANDSEMALPNVAALLPGLPGTEGLTFQWETLELSGPHTPKPSAAFQASCVVGSKIYFFGTDRSAEKVLVLNTETNSWDPEIIPKTKLKLEQVQSRFFPVGAWRLGDDLIAVLDGQVWYFFDLKTLDWSDHRLERFEYPSWRSGPQGALISPGSHDAFVFDNQETVRWTDFIRGNDKTLTPQWGEIPYDRRCATFPVDDHVLCFASDRSSQRGSESSMFVHDPRGGKWRAFPIDFEDKRKDSQCVGYIVTRVGHLVLILSADWGQPYHLTICDVARRTWVQLPPSPNAPIHESPDCLPVLVESKNRIFLWAPNRKDEEGGIKLHVLTLRGLENVVSCASEFDSAFSRDFASIFSRMQPPADVRDEFCESNVLEERDIVTNDQLEPCDWKNMQFHREIEQSLQGLFRKTPIVSPSFLRHNLPVAEEGKPQEIYIFHKNMVTYLTIAYDAHFSVILTPDMIFYTLLCELADEIKGQPEKFEMLFTSTPGQKQKVITISEDPELLDLNQVVAKLKTLIPDGNSEMLTAKFSTTDVDSLLAMNAAFADAMSPYYDYFSSLCGIPRVRVLGTKADWEQIETKLSLWRHKFGALPRNGSDDSSSATLDKWLLSAAECVRDIYTRRDPTFWREFFSINRCSSGHTDVVEGWITRLYRCGYSRKYRGVLTYGSNDFYNFESHISTVKWTQIETGNKYGLYTGLLYSTVVQNTSSASALDEKFPFLEPHFAHLVRDENPRALSKNDYDAYLAALPEDDAMFLSSYREFMDTPVVLGSSQEKIRQKRQLVLAKYKQMRLWALEGDPRARSLRFNFEFATDISFAPFANNKDSVLEDPLMRQIAEAIRGVFAAGKTVETVALSPDCGLGDFWDLIFEGLQSHPTVRKIELDSSSYSSDDCKSPSFFGSPSAPLCKLLLSDNMALESISIGFGYGDGNTDLSSLAKAISNTRAPLREFEGNNVPLAVALALCDRIAHKTIPMTSVKMSSTAFLAAEPWTIPEAVMRHLSEQDSDALSQLNQFELSLFNWTIQYIQDPNRTAAEIDAAKARIRELAQLYVTFLQKAKNLQYHSPNLTGIDDTSVEDQQIVAAICGLPLRKFSVLSRNLNDEASAKLITSLKGLRQIDAVAAGLGDPVGVAVGRALESPGCQLEEVVLSKNRLTHLGATAIFTGALSASTTSPLKVLKLYKCDIGSGAIDSLVQLLSSEKCALQVLHLGANPLTVQDVNRIISALKENKSLTELKLDVIRLGASDAAVLAGLSDTLKVNRTMQSVTISCHSVSKADLDRFASEISGNTTLISFSIERWGGDLLGEIIAILLRNRALLKQSSQK